MTYNTKTEKEKKIRIWVTIIRHRGLGHKVQESWPYLLPMRFGSSAN